MTDIEANEAQGSQEEPVGDDHSKGLLLLRWIKGKLRALRARDLRDAANRGEFL